MTIAVHPALLIQLLAGAGFGALLARFHLLALRRAVELQVASTRLLPLLGRHLARIAATVAALALAAWTGKAAVLLAMLAGFEVTRRYVLHATAPR